MSFMEQPKIKCDICDGQMTTGQGYGVRGMKSDLQYTPNLMTAHKHSCNGCMVAICWIFDDSVKKADKPELRF